MGHSTHRQNSYLFHGLLPCNKSRALLAENRINTLIEIGTEYANPGAVHSRLAAIHHPDHSSGTTQ